MRIGLSDAAVELPVVHGADRNSTAGQGSVTATSPFPKDTTEISATAAASSGGAPATVVRRPNTPQVATLVQQAFVAGSARSARVAQLRDSVAAGEYRVVPEKIADALIRETE